MPKSITPDRIKQSFLGHTLVVGKEDMRLIKTLDKGYRFVDGKFFEIPGNGYVNIYDE